MAKEKIYAPVSAKQHDFQNGGHCIKLGINVDKFMAFMQSHKNAKGYVNLVVTERREVGQYGDTHSVSLDTWEPKPNREQDDPPPRTTQATQTNDGVDKLPF